MYKIWCGAIFLLACITCSAQPPGYAILTDASAFEHSFSQTTASTESIRADFSQEKSLSLLSEKISSSGKFWFHKKDKLKMEYLKPFSYTLILNADRIYIRDGEKETKLSASSNNAFRQVNHILIDCVSGNMLRNPDFQYTVYQNPGHFLILLRPLARNLKAVYKNINIVLDKTDYSVTAVELDEISGDRTTLRFLNKEINVPIPETVFAIP